MKCPTCNTENRDDQASCYHCQNDLTILRTIITRAKQHYNNALEHAERGRTSEAIAELKQAIELNSKHVPSHNVLGTLYAKKRLYKEAIVEWEIALAIDPASKKSHDYIQQALDLSHTSILTKKVARLSNLSLILLVVVIISLSLIGYFLYLDRLYLKGEKALNNNDFRTAYTIFTQVMNNRVSTTMARGAQLAISKMDQQLQIAVNNIEQKRVAKKYEEGLEICARMEKMSLPQVWRRKMRDQKSALLIAIVTRDLPSAIDIYYKKGDYEKAVQAVEQIKSKYSDLGDVPEYITAITKLQNDFLTKQLQDIDQLRRAKKFGTAIELAKYILTKKPHSEWQTKLEIIIAEIKKEKTQSDFQQIQAYYQNKQYEPAYSMLTAIDASGLDAKQQVWLNKELPNIKSGLLKQYWKDIGNQTEAIFSQNLTAESAQQIIKKAEFIILAAPAATFADDVLFYKGLALEQLKRWNQAIASYTQLKKQFSQSAFIDDSLYRTGSCYEQLKQYDQAIASYQNLIQQYPKGSYAGNPSSRIKALQKTKADADKKPVKK